MLLLPAGSAAAQRDVPTLQPSGSLVISWRGEAASNCQGAGACGVSGSLEVTPQQQQGSESPPTSDVQIDDADSAARVMVQGAGGAPDRVCADPAPVSLSLLVERRSGRARHAVIEGQQGSLSSGRCAGPTASDLARIDLAARRLPGHREAYDLTGTSTFDAGPYRVTVASTLRGAATWLDPRDEHRRDHGGGVLPWPGARRQIGIGRAR